MTDNINAPLEELVARLLENRDSLCAYLYMHLRNWDETEDLFQEVSMVIMRKANERLEVRHFKAWSREIARRTMLDYWKRKKKIPLPLAEEDLQACENAWQRKDAEPHLLSERMERLKICVERLSGDLRRMLGLRYEKDCSLREIASALGKTEGAVQVALSRARAALLRCMQTVKIS
jgi:RNA polymerase sigma-70 factor (ECF subfamily)